MIKHYFNQVRSITNSFFWLLNGKIGNPPHFIKQSIVKNYAKSYRNSVLVETGSYLGDMIISQYGVFSKIYSIEISDLYYQRLLKIFGDSKKVKLILGDSAVKLPSILDEINEDVIFWLDGHFSGGKTGVSDLGISPILFEVKLILDKRPTYNDIILIDDARLFGTDGYPTVEKLIETFGNSINKYTWFIADDVIRFIPKEIYKI